ncbi:hypothetical protein [Winogradskyella sp.]|uniref:hypothetical protein n=1 Tax=Winogradskyella sp. TaxID=1883156 RepID=UPI00261586EA|nr:hypothetical protein [Winogradskyella sp.]
MALSDADFSEKIFFVLFVNLFYHICFFGLSWFPRNKLLKIMSKERPVRIFLRIVLGVIMVSSFLYPIKQLISSFQNGDYSSLFMIFITVGLFLGAISFWISLSQEQ